MQMMMVVVVDDWMTRRAPSADAPAARHAPTAPVNSVPVATTEKAMSVTRVTHCVEAEAGQGTRVVAVMEGDTEAARPACVPAKQTDPGVAAPPAAADDWNLYRSAKRRDTAASRWMRPGAAVPHQLTTTMRRRMKTQMQPEVEHAPSTTWKTRRQSSR